MIRKNKPAVNARNRDHRPRPLPRPPNGHPPGGWNQPGLGGKHQHMVEKHAHLGGASDGSWTPNSGFWETDSLAVTTANYYGESVGVHNHPGMSDDGDHTHGRNPHIHIGGYGLGSAVYASPPMSEMMSGPVTSVAGTHEIRLSQSGGGQPPHGYDGPHKHPLLDHNHNTTGGGAAYQTNYQSQTGWAGPNPDSYVGGYHGHGTYGPQMRRGGRIKRAANR